MPTPPVPPQADAGRGVAASDDAVFGGFTDASAAAPDAVAWQSQPAGGLGAKPAHDASDRDASDSLLGVAAPVRDAGDGVGVGAMQAGSAAQAGDPAQPSDAVRSNDAVQSKAARPRTGTIVACGVLGAAFLALAALAYAKGVLTDAGQGYDTMVWWTLSSQVPFTKILSGAFHASAVVLGVAGVAAAASLAIAAARRRMGLVIQLVAFAAVVLVVAGVAKTHLPRPVFNLNRPNPANSAPSGHTLLFTAAMLALMLAVPRAWRAWVALIGWLANSAIGLALVAGQWHRPSDVVMSVFIAGAVACMALAFTRGSGMDRIVNRKPSAAVQIVAPALVMLGVMALGYSLYGIWQLLPNLADEPTWGMSIACESAVSAIVGSNALVAGVVCALRQLTASPLSGAGIFGTPPRPPKAG